jgi:hypothetical protein
MKCVIKTSTGSVLRWGYCEFEITSGETQVDLVDQTPPSATVPCKFWKVVSGYFEVMSQSEKDAVKAEEDTKFFHSLGSPTESPFEIDWTLYKYQKINAVANLEIKFKGPFDSEGDKIKSNSDYFLKIVNSGIARTWTWNNKIIWLTGAPLSTISVGTTYLKITSVNTIYLVSFYA